MLVLEFHFNDFDRRISAHTHSDGRISFTSLGATCGGFNKIAAVEDLLGVNEQEIVRILKELTETGSMKQVVLQLHDHLLKPDDLSAIKEVRARLPGGEKSLLPSIEKNRGYHEGFMDLRPYHCAPSTATHTNPARPTSPAPKNAMVPLECEDFFSTVDEACAQLWYSASVAHDEEQEALRLWSGVEHTAQMYKCRDMTVLAVAFAPHPTLTNEKFQLKLLKALEVKVYSAPGDRLHNDTGRHLEENPGLPPHDVFFRLTCSAGAVHRNTARVNGKLQSFKVKLVPHENKFGIDSQMKTVRDLRRADQWHPVLLNQHHDKIELHDTTASAGLAVADREALDHSLRSCKPWDAEQLQVIDSVTSSKGRL
jgi:hypothetical protein